MIRFLLTRGFEFTHKTVRESLQRPPVNIVRYDDILRAQWLRHATYVFTDLDRLSFWELEQAAQLYLRLKEAGFPVLNNPAMVKKRFALLRALHAAGLNDFNAYRVDELSPAMRFPVFLRKEHGHGAPLSGLMQTHDEVLKAVDAALAAGIPAEALMVIEYAGEPVREGQFRKLAAFCIGREIVQYHGVNDNQWLVKDGRKDPEIEDLYLDELRLVQANPFAEHLQKVFDVAQIDYGRADFGMLKGRIQVFEINTNPTITPPFYKHPSLSRRESTALALQKYLAALYSIDSKSGKPMHFPPLPMDRAAMARNDHRRKTRALQRTHDTRAALAGLAGKAAYNIGTTIDFSESGNAVLYKGRGWAGAESWGTWTQGRCAVLHIRFHKAPARDLRLEALARGLVQASQPAAHAGIHVNGQNLATWELARAGMHNFKLTIPGALLQREECEIAFHISGARSPKSLGMSDDGRLLGLGFHSLAIRET